MPVAPRSYLTEVRSRFIHNKAGVCALGVLALLVLSAVFAPLLTPYDPNAGEVVDRLKPIGTAGHR